jgi:hemolysin activation/secretion protein
VSDKLDTHKQKTYTQEELNKELTRLMTLNRNARASVDVQLSPGQTPDDRSYVKIEIRGGDPINVRNYVRAFTCKLLADLDTLDA